MQDSDQEDSSSEASEDDDDEEEEVDQKLMDKLDNIKKNLRDPSNQSGDSYQQKDRTMKNLEEVLKR